MFRGVEVGAWYWIQVEGRNIFGKILERHRNVCTVQYLDDDGQVVTCEVSRSDIRGRLGDDYISSLESAMAAVGQQKTAPPAQDATISAGDWHRFEYEEDIVAGVVYRIEGDQYTMFFLYDGIPTFTTLPLSCIGPQEERLSERFRREMARNPDHLEEWLSKAGKSSPQPTMVPEKVLARGTASRQSSPAQKRLFPK